MNYIYSFLLILIIIIGVVIIWRNKKKLDLANQLITQLQIDNRDLINRLRFTIKQFEQMQEDYKNLEEKNQKLLGDINKLRNAIKKQNKNLASKGNSHD